MNKENILFSLVGVLLGFIVGFVFANTANRAGAPALTTAAPGAAAPGQQAAGLPPGHPPVENAAFRQSVDPAAVRDAAKLAEEKQDNFDAQVAAARLAAQAERFDDAVKYFERANKLRPDDYDTLVALGNTLFDAEKFADAERWYAAALSKRPDDVNVRTDYGLTFMLREPAQIDRAVAEFKRSLELQPNHAQTLQNLAVAYTREGDAAQARTTIAKLEAVSPNSEALPQLRAKVEELSSSASTKTPAETAPGKSGNK
jgi:tetratricopeptide (TPR) repeat protein